MIIGEAIAWIIGWDLLLEYGVAVAAVSVGWGAYLAYGYPNSRLRRDAA